jgi:3'-phosphoadenosine 5'-phosphosulfate sulfotransferase (PAPS reductase)/FAD synthetase
MNTQFSSTSEIWRLPHGNVQVCLSGGRSSAYMLARLADENDITDPRVQIIFTNTGREMPETLDFVRDLQAHFGAPIVWLEYRPGQEQWEQVDHATASRDGEPFADLVRKKNYLPNAVARFCTADLKVRPAKRYLVSLGWSRWTNALGIRADEAHRARPAKKERWENWYPMADAGTRKADVAEYWKSMPFDLRLQAYQGKTPFGNCDGCFLKSEATLAALARDFPDRAQWWQDLEAEIGATFHKKQSRKVLNNFVQQQGDWLFDDEAALCQVDGGECHG